MNTGDANESSSSHDWASLPDSLAGFLEMAFDAAVVFDPQERITSWNPAAEQMYGWTAQEAIGKTSAELFWPARTPQEQKNRKQKLSNLKQGEILRGEYETCCKDGLSLRVQFAVRAIFNGDGKLTGYVAICRDISTQEALRESEERYRAVIESALDAIIVTDPSAGGRVLSANPAACRMFGYSPEEFEGLSREAILDTSDVNLTSLLEQRARYGQGSAELTYKRKDGTRFPGEISSALYLDKNGGTRAVAIIRDITERKQKEEALRARSEEVETLLEVSPVAIFVAHDPGCVHITGNPAAYRLVGFPENSKANISKSAPEHERPTYRTLRYGVEVRAEDLPMQRAARLGVEVNGDEVELCFDDGTQKFIYVFAKPLFDARGQSRGVIAAMLDITERKRAEELLERGSRKLNEILESIQDDFYVLDRDWVFVYANRQFTSKIGKEPEDFVGNNIWKMFPKHIGTIFEENLRAAMEKREMRRFEIPGKYTNAWYRMTAFPSEEGITVLGTDNTESKRAELALQESEERYRDLVKYAPAGIYEVDPRTRRFVEVNDSMCEILGYTREELLSMRADELLDEEGKERFQQRMLQTLAGEKVSQQIEYKVKARDGHEICGILNTTINYEGGKPRSISVIAHDITERKQAEEALRQNERQLQLLNETLEQKVHEKTAEVHQLASDLIKAVQHERHRISHILHDDLQQRIYAVQMQLTLLRDELQAGDEAARREVSDIEQQLAEILEVTRHLSIDLSPPILHGEGLAHAISWLAAQMQQRYGLPIELQANGPFTVPDEALHVLLFNCVRELLFNVVKHAQATQVVVALQWVGAGLRIEVSDNGRGFPVGAPDRQASGEMNGENGSRPSLGLSTIRQQLNLFGGHLEIQSEPGAGAQVMLIVPLPSRS